MGLVFGELKKHPEIYADAPFSMSVRAANDKRRHERLLQFEGPDPDTVQLLCENLDDWEQNPALFWTHASPSLSSDLLMGIAMFYRRVNQIGP
jgi:hypothetical protein